MLCLKEVLKLDGKLLNEARALRYLIDAVEDLMAAEVLLDKEVYNLVLFHCQQASEKSSKACLSLFGIILADEHKYAGFLQKMVVPNSGRLRNKFTQLMVKVSVLENLYIISRYGVDKEGRIHLREFEKEDVDDAFNAATDFTELCFLFLEEKLNAKLPRKKDLLVAHLKANYKELIK